MYLATHLTRILGGIQSILTLLLSPENFRLKSFMNLGEFISNQTKMNSILEEEERGGEDKIRKVNTFPLTQK